jgi:hypothetical protein
MSARRLRLFKVATADYKHAGAHMINRWNKRTTEALEVLAAGGKFVCDSSRDERGKLKQRLWLQNASGAGFYGRWNGPWRELDAFGFLNPEPEDWFGDVCRRTWTLKNRGTP